MSVLARYPVPRAVASGAVDPSRLYFRLEAVAAEAARTINIIGESRSLPIIGQSRTLSTFGESRTVTIIGESRTIKSKKETQ